MTITAPARAMACAVGVDQLVTGHEEHVALLDPIERLGPRA